MRYNLRYKFADILIIAFLSFLSCLFVTGLYGEFEIYISYFKKYNDWKLRAKWITRRDCEDHELILGDTNFLICLIM